LPGLIEGHSHLFLHPYNETSLDDQVLKRIQGRKNGIERWNMQRHIEWLVSPLSGTSGRKAVWYDDVGLADCHSKSCGAGALDDLRHQGYVAQGAPMDQDLNHRFVLTARRRGGVAMRMNMMNEVTKR
jgi:hypothetical protein